MLIFSDVLQEFCRGRSGVVGETRAQQNDLITPLVLQGPEWPRPHVH